METQYYDGTKLLSLKDVNGQQPEIYICCSNRSAGKTTFFGRYFVNRWKNHGEKFILIYRYNYELSDVADKFFKEIKFLFFPDDEMESKSRAKGIYHELFYNGDPCGFAVSVNNADQLKKMSHLFSDCKRMLFDEFQSESNHYCDNEIQKFQSLHTSIARGSGDQVKYLPVFMLGNFVTLLNPYFIALGISERLNIKTKFLKGNGYVVEQGFYECVADRQRQSGFNRAFENSDYVQFTTEKMYLNDNSAFISAPAGSSKYLCTLKCDGINYAVRSYPEAGIVYCDKNYDVSFPVKITVSADDHQLNYIMLKKNDLLINLLRWYFEHGCFRFKDLQCKQAILKTCAFR